MAAVGENRKMLVFPVADLPEMGRGKGVRLQKYKDGGLSDARTFTLDEGLSWLDPAGRTRTVTSEPDVPFLQKPFSKWTLSSLIRETLTGKRG